MPIIREPGRCLNCCRICRPTLLFPCVVCVRKPRRTIPAGKVCAVCLLSIFRCCTQLVFTQFFAVATYYRAIRIPALTSANSVVFLCTLCRSLNRPVLVSTASPDRSSRCVTHRQFPLRCVLCCSPRQRCVSDTVKSRILFGNVNAVSPPFSEIISGFTKPSVFTNPTNPAATTGFRVRRSTRGRAFPRRTNPSE